MPAAARRWARTPRVLAGPVGPSLGQASWGRLPGPEKGWQGQGGHGQVLASAKDEGAGSWAGSLVAWNFIFRCRSIPFPPRVAAKSTNPKPAKRPHTPLPSCIPSHTRFIPGTSAHLPCRPVLPTRLPGHPALPMPCRAPAQPGPAPAAQRNCCSLLMLRPGRARVMEPA